MTRRKRTPKQAMSARSVDKLERELIGIRALVDRLTGATVNGLKVVRRSELHGISRRLTRLLASVRRAEMR